MYCVLCTYIMLISGRFSGPMLPTSSQATASRFLPQSASVPSLSSKAMLSSTESLDHSGPTKSRASLRRVKV